jgi:NADPH-dependent 2,4-dienoyl-CoA reductase/sulfur reductase-like enzyme
MAERIVVIGGDAGGMAAISQIRKRKSDAEIVVFEKGHWTSYSACGIPYVVAGQVAAIERLVARTPAQFRELGVDVRMRHEVTAIDLAARHVEVRDIEGQTTLEMGFDQLLIATGGSPIRPPIPGIELDFVHGVQTLDDAADLLAHVAAGRCQRVVVVGGGYIGLEMAEAFVERGAVTTLVDSNEQPMKTLDTDMGALIADALRHHSVDVRLRTEVRGFEEGAVLTDTERLEADLVVLGIGVRPNSQLAREAGLRLGVRDAIAVDRRQHTSAGGVWSAGDCAETFHLVTQQPTYVALGTVANKAGRVAGINMGGGDAVLPGVVGTAISKICATEVARTGLAEWEARDAGLAHVATTIESTTNAGYMPTARPMTVKMVAEAGSGRLLGAQIVGGSGAAKRIDTVAVALHAGLDVQQVVDLDLAYAPPFSGVWDPVLIAARELLKLI